MNATKIALWSFLQQLMSQLLWYHGKEQIREHSHWNLLDEGEKREMFDWNSTANIMYYNTSEGIVSIVKMVLNI